MTLQQHAGPFPITVEVVPPAGPDPAPVLARLEALAGLPIDGFSVATNPLARPRMSALALTALIQARTDLPATLHLTTRDHNRLSLQALLWGAHALRIGSVLCATGDFVALRDAGKTTTVRDVDVYGLIRMAREADLHTGAVLDPHPERRGLAGEVRRLRKKAAAGAQFAVTQPVYDEAGARELGDATAHLSIPIILGVLPLRTARHAVFLHDRVAGIAVPPAVRARMANAADPVAEGVALAREMVAHARDHFAGVFLMPPFDRYDVVERIMS